MHVERPKYGKIYEMVEILYFQTLPEKRWMFLLVNIGHVVRPENMAYGKVC